MSQYPLNRLLLLAFGSSVLFIGNILPQIYGQTLNNSSLGIQEGISSGDITDHSAIIWSRANQQSIMHIEYNNNSLSSHQDSKIKWVDNTTDFTGHIKLDELTSNTKYFYRVWFLAPIIILIVLLL